MSPRSTFHSWGSSSSDQRLSHRPGRVIRGSPGTLNMPGVGRLAVHVQLVHPCFRASALSTMVRNLSSSKRRPVPADPRLAKQDRPGRVAADPDRQEREPGRKDHQRHSGHQNVEEST